MTLPIVKNRVGGQISRNGLTLGSCPQQWGSYYYIIYKISLIDGSYYVIWYKDTNIVDQRTLIHNIYPSGGYIRGGGENVRNSGENVRNSGEIEYALEM